jgi:hypothetical protein
MKIAQVFTSEKEPAEVSRETVRRGVEFLSQRQLSEEDLAVLARYGLSATRVQERTSAH